MKCEILDTILEEKKDINGKLVKSEKVDSLVRNIVAMLILFCG